MQERGAGKAKEPNAECGLGMHTKCGVDGNALLDRAGEIQDIFHGRKAQAGRNHVNHGIYRLIEVTTVEHKEFHGIEFNEFLQERGPEQESIVLDADLTVADL